MHSVNVVIFSPAQLNCVRHSQNLEPTIHGTSELALSVFKRQLKTHLFQHYRLVLAAAVGVVYRRPALATVQIVQRRLQMSRLDSA